MPNNVEFPKATDRHDRYHSFRFLLKWDGRYVAGLSRVSGLSRTTQVVTHRADGDASTPRRMPGQSESNAITLERGVSYDFEFQQWANKAWDCHNFATADHQGGSGNPAVPLKNFHQNFTLELYNEADQKVTGYNIYRAWPSEFIAMAAPDASGLAVAIMSLKLEIEGWQREDAITNPNEPSFLQSNA